MIFPANEIILGVDFVSVARLGFLLERFGERLHQLIFTQYEWSTYGSYPLRLAGRFAAKEAIGKAFGVGLAHMSRDGIPATDVEIRHSTRGAPILHLYGQALKRAELLKVVQIQISISHDPQFAMASAFGITSVESSLFRRSARQDNPID